MRLEPTSPGRPIPSSSLTVLLVGGPESIPFQFQNDLDVQYAVGRIHFETPEDYYNYSRSVIRAEQLPRRPQRAAFFGVENDGDRAIERTCRELFEPLARRLALKKPDWDIETLLAEAADRARLQKMLGPEAPALLFAACHGLAFPLNDERQVEEQGALLCQDWPGPDGGAVERAHYFAAEDIAPDAGIHGLIVFLLACHSAGTPETDTFAEDLFGRPRRIASSDFLSRLPQKLLSHPPGSALAVVGHIDRGWTTSFRSRGRGGQINAFESALQALLEGVPIGYAMEYLNQRYAQLGAALSNLQEKRLRGQGLSARHYSHIWRSALDARNLLVFGDPAVRLSTWDEESFG